MTKHVIGFIASCAITMALIAGCKQVTNQTQSTDQEQSGPVQEANTAEVPDGWDLTVEGNGITRKYTSDGDVTYDKSTHAYYFVDSSTGNTVYISDKWFVTMVSR